MNLLHQAALSSRQRWQTHWCRPPSCPCPGRSSLCQTWMLTVSWKVLCSIGTGSCFHCLHKHTKTIGKKNRWCFIKFQSVLDWCVHRCRELGASSVENPWLVEQLSNYICVTDSFPAWSENTFSIQGVLTTGNIVSIGSQAYKVFLVDVTLEGAKAVRFVHVPQLQLTVCWTAS